MGEWTTRPLTFFRKSLANHKETYHSNHVTDTMNHTDKIARIKALNEERLEIIEEKNLLTEELMGLKTKLTSLSYQKDGKEITDLQTRRTELVKEIDEMNADIADINAELKTLEGGGKAASDFRNVLTLIAAYIAAGDDRPADVMTRSVIAELEIITRTFEESKTQTP